MKNQIGSFDKVGINQQHVDEAIARVSCPDGGKWMLELVRVIELFIFVTLSSCCVCAVRAECLGARGVCGGAGGAHSSGDGNCVRSAQRRPASVSR